MILSWYEMILQRANSSGKAFNNSLPFSYKNGFDSLNNVVTDQYSLRIWSDNIQRMVIFEKVSISSSFTASKSTKDSTNFVIISIVLWVVTLRVFLIKSVNTAGSSIVNVEKTWCKLMVRLLLLCFLKYSHWLLPSYLRLCRIHITIWSIPLQMIRPSFSSNGLRNQMVNP